MHKKFFKRSIAIVMAIIIAFSSAITAFAATTRSDWNGHHRFKVNGNDAYCIDFAAVSADSGKVSSDAYETYSKLSSSKRANIEYAITAAHELGYYNGSYEQYFGVQYYIWMQACKSDAQSGLSDWFKTMVEPYYKAVVDKVAEIKDISPNFETYYYKLTSENLKEKFVDNAGNLKKYWTVGSPVKEVDPLKDKKMRLHTKASGNTIHIWAVEQGILNLGKGNTEQYRIPLTCKVAFYSITSKNCYKFGNQAVVYTGTSEQETRRLIVKITGDKKEEPKYGAISVTKKLGYNGSTSYQKGVEFNIYAFDEGKGKYPKTPTYTIKTNADGIATKENLDFGKYKVVEVVPEYTHPFDLVTTYEVDVQAEKTYPIKTEGKSCVLNTVEAGDFLVHKLVSDVDENGQVIPDSYSKGTNGTSAKGFQFRLKGTSDLGMAVDMTSTTDANGKAYFCNVPVGKYNLSEITTENDKYIMGNSQNTQKIEIVWDKQKTYSNYMTTNASDFQSIKIGNGTGANNYSYVNETGYEVYTQNDGNASGGASNNATDVKLNYNFFDEDKSLDELVGESNSSKAYIYFHYKDADVQYNTKDYSASIIYNGFYSELKHSTDYVYDEDEEGYVPSGFSYDEMLVEFLEAYGVNSITYNDVVATSNGFEITVTPVADDVDNSTYDDTLTNSVDTYTKAQKYFNYINIMKSFRVEMQKVDADSMKAQPKGDATLEGAVYGLYRTYNGTTKLVGTYTTDDKGKFTTAPFVVLGTYTIKELVPSKGYTLDPETYTVFDSSYNTSNWNSTVKTYTVNSSGKAYLLPEAVEKAPLEIIKTSAYSDELSQAQFEANAKFEVYLKDKGSYDACADYERDVVTTDENGYAKTKDLVYGTYVIHQIEVGDKNSHLCADVEISNHDNNTNNTVTLINLKYKAYVNVVKKDADSGKTVPLAGASFRIYKADNDGNFVNDEEHLITFNVTSPEETTITDFYTDETGTVNSPAQLKCGTYYLVETKAPYGYKLNSEPVKFEITKATQKNAKINGAEVKVVYTSMSDTVQKGRISLYKYGNVFDSVNTTEEGFTQPVFNEGYLEGAEFNIIANTDIYSPEGTLLVAENDIVGHIVTGADGFATSDYLYINADDSEPEYALVETKAPYGYILSEEKTLVNLHYDEENAALELEANDISVSINNDRQGVAISLYKLMEKDDLYNLGHNNEVENVYFGLFANEDITARDGSVITADSLIAASYVSAIDSETADGCLTFDTDIPMGYSYYIQEIQTNNFYVTNDTKFEFTFDTDNRTDSVIYYEINDGQVIENELARTKIVGTKTDVDGKLVEGAVYGLFASETTEFTADTAITTATSDSDGKIYFSFIPNGNYIVCEISVPEPYTVSDEKVYVEVDGHYKFIDFRVEDDFITGNISLYKYDAEYPENTLSGAEFTVYYDRDEDGVFSSNVDEFCRSLRELEDDKGHYFLEKLRYGHYLVKETKAPEGFELDENYYPVNITEDGKTYIVENNGECFINNALKGSLHIVKTSSNDVVEGFSFKISGTSLIGREVDLELTTDENGEITINDLPIGSYTVAEVKNDMTVNYVVPEAQEVAIEANETTEVEFFNELIEEPEPDNPEPDDPHHEEGGGGKTGFDNAPFAIAFGSLTVSLIGIGACVTYIIKNRKRSTNE